jgi:hypothetical protein
VDDELTTADEAAMALEHDAAVGSEPAAADPPPAVAWADAPPIAIRRG